MILELVEWLATPCPIAVRRLGYLGSAVALVARYERHRAAWAPHLDACKDVIRNAVEGCASHRRVVVLGSGPLLDTPLEDLSATFDTVELVDVVHLRRARRAARQFNNVTHRTDDITGLAAALLANGNPPTAESLRPPTLAADTDLVISANLLSQLPDLPCAWLRRRHGLSEEVIAELSRTIIQHHLDWLAGLAAQVCLITETRRAYVDSGGVELRSWDALFGIPAPPGRTWSWAIAPAGEHVPDLTVRNTVCGIADLRTTLAEAGKQGI